jgi:putative endonuclease
MRIFSWSMLRLIELAAYRGVEPDRAPARPSGARPLSQVTGVRGETYAYWYLRNRGYTIIARNFTVRGMKGEIDLVGYDGAVLAFVEVKTRAVGGPLKNIPEDAVTADKRRHLSRMARQFLNERRITEAPCRFDVIAIESRPGRRPNVRLHKGAFAYH